MARAPDLIPLSERVYYLPGSVNCAVVVGEGGQAVLIDTGQDKDHGRRLAKACEALGLTPAAIINTHSHADHYGGNDYLTRSLGLLVYAPPFEASIMRDPYLEPVYLFSGAKPPAEMLNKWLLAKPSPVDYLLTPGELKLFGVSLTLIDTSGHAHRHYAVQVDEVLIAADAVFGLGVLEKYPLPFGQDIGRQRASMAAVGALGARVVLPGHGEPTVDLVGLVAANLATLDRAAEVVAAACTDADGATVLKAACDALGIAINDLPRYTLNLCTVQAYLCYLRETGRVSFEMRDNRLCWQQGQLTHP